MKMKAGLTYQEKRRIKDDYLNNWHDCFAWFPVRITHVNNESYWYWLEKIQRKRIYLVVIDFINIENYHK